MLLLGIEPGGDIGRRHLTDRALQLVGVLPHGDRVHVDDAIDALVRLLHLDPLHHGAEIIAEMQVAGRLHAGKDALFECHWSPFNDRRGFMARRRGPRKAAISSPSRQCSERPWRRGAAGQKGSRLAKIECPRCKHRNGVGEETGPDQGHQRQGADQLRSRGLEHPVERFGDEPQDEAHDGAGQYDAGQRAFQAAVAAVVGYVTQQPTCTSRRALTFVLKVLLIPWLLHRVIDRLTFAGTSRR